VTGGTTSVCCKARGSSCTTANDCCNPSNVYGGHDDCIDGYCCGAVNATCTNNGDCCYPNLCQPGGPNGTKFCAPAFKNQSPLVAPWCTGAAACWSGDCEDPDPNDGQDGNRCWAKNGVLCPGQNPGPAITGDDNDCWGFGDKPAGWNPVWPAEECQAKDAKGRFICCSEPSNGCNVGGDCCNGNCLNHTCTCNAAHGSCHSPADCCNSDQGNICTASPVTAYPPVRGAAGLCCIAAGTATLHCTADTDCCSGKCLLPAGNCKCGGSGTTCYKNADCCSNSCSASGACA
jgi:hypothetical protein